MRHHPNVFDELLYYVSHVGEMRWSQFQRGINAVERETRVFKSDLPYLITLGCLGHLDFNPEEWDWVFIAPTTLVETAVAGRYVLVGSRTPDLVMALAQVISATGGQFDVIPETYAPTTLFLHGLTEKSILEVEDMGVHIRSGFSAKLSTVLPCLREECFEVILPPREAQLEKFNVDTLVYEKAQRLLSEGLYRVPRYGRGDYVLKLGPHQRRVPREWGTWLALHAFHKSGFIRYRTADCLLQVRARLTLPLLANRCATLCSGRPAVKQNRFSCYRDVPVGIAYRLAASLHQKLEVVT